MEKLHKRMQRPLLETGKSLGLVVRGFMNYHAVPTNFGAVDGFRDATLWLWRGALNRRGDKDKTTWDRITKLADSCLPTALILHSWPEQRSPSDSEVEAVCVEAASTDLCRAPNNARLPPRWEFAAGSRRASIGRPRHLVR